MTFKGRCMEEKIKGFVEHITFRSEETGYTVLTLSSDGEEITAVGVLPEVGEGETIECEGSFQVHSTYGRQFRIRSFELSAPEDQEAMERYLASGLIKGIGKSLAHRIVKKFRNETFNIIENEPDRLAEINGISDRKARDIYDQVLEKKDQRDGVLFLSRYGISNTLAVRIWKTYGSDIYRIIRENPYRLADELRGVGFRTADEIARKAGMAADSHFRVESGILYALQLSSGEGNLYLPKEELLAKAAALLGMPGVPFSGMEDDLAQPFFFEDGTGTYFQPGDAQNAEATAKNQELMEDCLKDMTVDRRVILKEEEGQKRVYEPRAYYTELRVAKMLCDLNVSFSQDEEKAKADALSAAAKTKTSLDEKQLQAVIMAESSGVLILTGGPGTGKTTTINTMITLFEAEGQKIALAAPTGRAAKRMTEATGHEARTIHRLLEVSGDPEKGTVSFGKNDDEPLEEDVIIIDEMSMVDIFLMSSLLKAVPVGSRLVLVGDASQLPSVGPGRVLKDMIASGILPTVTLTRVFRQAQESDIVMNAHKINRGEHPNITNDSKDFFFMKRQKAEDIISAAIGLVRGGSFARYVGADPSDIQVMTPMKKGLVGTMRLNQVMQQAINPQGSGKKEWTRGDVVFREGDRVMQIRNNYQSEWTVRGRYGTVIDTGTGIYNGDMGIIRRIDPLTDLMTVEFDERRCVEYEKSELDQLELAYAVTIHKAQGSEYPAVVIPMLRGPRMLMNRNLIYTAVTRARKCVVLVGDPQVFFDMIDNITEEQRYTTLSLRLKECFKAAAKRQEDEDEDPFAWMDE